MKFRTFNSLMVGTLVATTFYSVEAKEEPQNKWADWHYQANLSKDNHDFLERNCSTPVGVVELINLWQENAVYLKLGIESLAKNDPDFNVANLLEILNEKTKEIEEAIEELSNQDPNRPIFIDFGRALNRQNRLLLDYTVAYRDDNVPLQQDLLRQIEQANRQILHALIHILGRVDNLRERLLELLQQRIDTIIVEIENFVNAVNSTPPPGELADFGPAYTSYRLSLDISQELGRTIGNAALK